MEKRITKVTLRAPATTANLGPGFDSIGMALDIFNTISVELADSFEISITGQGANTLSHGSDNMVYRGFQALYRQNSAAVPAVRLTCHNEIPLKRGLGSSAAAVSGGLVAANLISGDDLPLDELLRLAEGIEGHPDNVAPALFGGCQIVVRDGDTLLTNSVPLPEKLSVVLLIPDFEIPTDKARAVLPSKIGMSDAIYNIGRAALLSVALATGNNQALRLATQDALHQPARLPLFPAMKKIFQAALDAGAYGVFLSGSGSTILAFAGEKEDQIAKAMLDQAAREGIQSTTRTARPYLSGVSVVDAVVEED